MENYQNQYGAVPASRAPVQSQSEILETTNVGGATQVIRNDYDGRTTAADATVVGESDLQHHHKKGILEKIKEKLPGTHHHQDHK